MGHCRTVGEVRETFRLEQGIGLEWEIPEFFLLPDSSDCIFYSPDFSYSGASWYWIVYPNGQAYCASQGWIVLFLCRRLCSPQRAVRFGLGVRRADGTEEDLLGDLRLPEGCTHLRVDEFLLRSDLLRRRCQLAPSNTLTVTCTMYRDETPCVRYNTLTYSQEPKPPSGQLKLNLKMDKNARTDNILTDSDEQKPTCVQFKFSEQMDKNARTDNTLTYSDEQNPTNVQFKINEQIDKNARTDNVLTYSGEQKPTNVQFKYNEQMYKNAKTGVSNMQRCAKRAMKCILKYVGNCMGRRY